MKPMLSVAWPLTYRRALLIAKSLYESLLISSPSKKSASVLLKLVRSRRQP
jgi:hypothetical protein